MAKLNLNAWDCKIVEKRKTWYTISLSIILVGLIVACIFGFNVGIDFSGGSILTVTTGDLYKDANYNDYVNGINEVLSANGLKAQITQKISAAETAGVQIRFQNNVNGKDADEETMFTINTKVKGEVEAKIADIVKANSSATDGEVKDNVQVTLSNVGATVSGELLLKAILSILIASALILLYVAVRFEFLSGLSAVIALMHDILIMTACMAVFRIQINASFVAALITIVGYSINSTIVLFDRVRENSKLPSFQKGTPGQLINASIKDTMTRSIYTTITTMITILLLAILGVAQVREFALPIIFGLIAGTYSSIFIAPTLWALLKEQGIKKFETEKRNYQASKK